MTHVTTAAGLHLATFLVCLVSGVVPAVNAEAYLLAVATVAPRSEAAAMVVLATAGQMTAKSLLYFAGRGVFVLPNRVGGERLRSLRLRLQASGRVAAGKATFASAALGFPPFYALSLLAGAAGWPFVSFLIAGSLGRFLRFAVFVGLPHLVRGVNS